MKVLYSALLWLGLAAMAAAQASAPPSQVVAPKPGASVPATAPAKSPFVPKAAPAKKGAVKNAIAPAKATPSASRGRRDPFINPVVKAVVAGGIPVVCNSGKRCLAINDMVLKGIVKSPNGMIAVVETHGQKTYFLHEKDPIFNGSVVKITGDSIIFRENMQDSAGRTQSREVVKSLTPPA